MGAEPQPGHTHADTHSSEASRCLHRLGESARLGQWRDDLPPTSPQRPRRGRPDAPLPTITASPQQVERAWRVGSAAQVETGGVARVTHAVTLPRTPATRTQLHGLASKRGTRSPAVVKGNDRGKKFTGRKEVETSSQETSSFKSKRERLKRRKKNNKK